MDNRARIVAGCRDAANDGRGYMIVFDDTDLIELLGFVEAGHRSRIGARLTERLDEITH